MVAFVRLSGLIAVLVFCAATSAWAQRDSRFREPDSQRCAVINCGASNGNWQSGAAAAAAAAEQRRRSEAAEDDRLGLEASHGGDWDAAAAWFIKALALEPNDETIRGHLQAARAGKADAALASEIAATRQRLDDAKGAADIEAFRRRFHVEALQLAIPAVCLVADAPETTEGCEVIGNAQLVWELAAADGNAEMLQILRDEFVGKIVFMSIDPSLPVSARYDLVEKMFDAEASAFARLRTQILDAQQDAQKAATLRTAYAIADAAAVEALNRRAHAESRQRADALLRYVAQNPDAPGVTFQCGPACRQLVGAAYEVGAFH